MSDKFKNRVFVVTGGARGIGKGIAAHLVSLGARVALIDADEATLAETVAEFGESAMPYICDITDEEQVIAVFKRLRSDLGRVDGLINNAGVIRDGLLVKARGGEIAGKLSAEKFDLVINVCMRGAFLCAREAATHMIECAVDDGVLINISSQSWRGNFGQTNYSAAKAGLVAMSAVWAKELGRSNIRSMVIAPGPIDTELLRSMPEDAMNALIRQVPVRRAGQIENIALAAAQIIENDFLTGSIIDVHGGLTI